MAETQRTNVTHDGETIEVEVEIMTPDEAAIEITDEIRAKVQERTSRRVNSGD